MTTTIQQRQYNDDNDTTTNDCVSPLGNKRWANRQFTFILSVVEANAVQALARAKKETAMPTLEFWRRLAEKMMTNRLGDNGVAAASPVRTWASLSNEHVISKRAKKEGKWNH